MEKIFLDEQLWYIENFLTEEEITTLMAMANEKDGWYKTQRSPSIRNKFAQLDIPVHPEGTICPTRGIDLSGDIVMLPQDGVKFDFRDDRALIFNQIFDKLEKVLPPTIVRSGIFQSFWPLTGDDDGGGAYSWHHEKGHSDDWNDRGMTATWSLYVNVDFEGGILEFKDLPHKIQPKAGMLVSIPMTKEWTHRVTPVTKGVRHTLYGTCFEDISDRVTSTSETC
jgi:hypothetical protein